MYESGKLVCFNKINGTFFYQLMYEQSQTIKGMGHTLACPTAIYFFRSDKRFNLNLTKSLISSAQKGYLFDQIFTFHYLNQKGNTGSLFVLHILIFLGREPPFKAKKSEVYAGTVTIVSFGMPCMMSPLVRLGVNKSSHMTAKHKKR